MNTTGQASFSLPADPCELSIDRALAARIQASFATFARDADGLAARFYERLFGEHQALRGMFPEDMSDQRHKLVATLAQVVRLSTSPSAARGPIAELGRRHAAIGARREHYPVVVDVMLAAMAEQAGSVWTGELEADWRAMLELVSQAMIAELGR